MLQDIQIYFVYTYGNKTGYKLRIDKIVTKHVLFSTLSHSVSSLGQEIAPFYTMGIKTYIKTIFSISTFGSESSEIMRI